MKLMIIFILQPLQVKRTNIKETIPTFSDFLTIAVTHNKTVIFDVTEPQGSNHPYQKGFVKLIIDAIKESNIHEEKVMCAYGVHGTYFVLWTFIAYSIIFCMVVHIFCV